ncbi:IS66 family transposase [Arenibacter sp. F26102]|uniref:IS66 family transposase n=1 Tax=Arenibacter sp. F26102 TaxID=2926416 RepID=UPI001FF260F3|nr:IS66 family transposase [Arenibacter sp. F26102]MCK0147430.1 IS66 family transposase [Arenibacter sp. F26102]
MITNELISSLVHCKHKYFLQLNGKPQNNDYTDLIANKRIVLIERFQSALIKENYNFLESANYDTLASITADGKYILTNIRFTLNKYRLYLDFLEVDKKKGVNTKIPVFIHPNSTITNEDRTIYYIIAYKFAEYTKTEISRIKLVCGEKSIVKIIKTNHEIAQVFLKGNFDLRQIQQSFSKIKHCNVCGYWSHCKNVLIERDDISLLGNIGKKEIAKYNNKGIFTLDQLSYTFRPRRSKKTSKENKRFQYGLRALALREKKTIIDTAPDFHEKACLIFFDFEGIPEEDFIYLIGLVVLENGIKTRHSFWADKKEKEPSIFLKFLSILKNKSSFTCYHYGSYELNKLMAFNKSNNNKYEQELTLIFKNSMNLLSIFNSKVHPPTYTNGLKDIASYYGFKWTLTDASGLKCLVLREQWNNTANDNLKIQIIQYNIEDCEAMDYIIQSVKSFNADKESREYIRLNRLTSQKYAHNSYNAEYFKNIAKYAYFDYQRTKVFLKTNNIIRKVQKKIAKKKPKPLVNKYVKLDGRCLCPECISANVNKHDKYSRIIYDLAYMSAGIKRSTIHYETYRFKCADCGAIFYNPHQKNQVPSGRYGNNLKIWVVYQYVACRVPMNKIQATLLSIFKLSIRENTLQRFKQDFARKYRSVYNKLAENLLQGNIIHADETKISIRGIDSKGYIWIFTNMETVIFIFRKTREVDFLKKLLKNFRGIFISDFYTGYDNLPCRQQKCLIHLIRDLNDDLYKNPLDFKFKELVIQFGDLINLIVATINNKGLKKRFIFKHVRDVEKFYKWLIHSKSDSELFEKYVKRFLKNRKKLFLFLEVDGIPWNNNNAEHGIKHFAAYRKVVDGLFSTNNIDEYLILLSIFQTCQYRHIDFLDFLRSEDMNLII